MIGTRTFKVIESKFEPFNRNVIWINDNVFKKWSGDGWAVIGGGGSGTNNYNSLTNKPSINGIELKGNIELDLKSDIQVINNLESTDKSNALAANQGRVLKESIETNIQSIKTLEANLNNKADKATTLSGYSIQDAYTKNEINELFDNIDTNISLDNYYDKAYIDEKLDSKQNIITDLEEIRQNANLALKEVPLNYPTRQEVEELIDKVNAGDVDLTGYYTKTEIDEKGFITSIPDDYITITKLNTELNKKVSVEEGKGLSTNDFTNEEKAKIESISNALDSKQDVLTPGTGIKIENNVISCSIESSSNVQSDWNETDSTSDSFIKNKPTLSRVATTGSYNDLIGTPDIPVEITEDIVTNWGFTKNTGTYVLPENGIPKSDLNDKVQESLSKADTALQSYEEQYTGTVTGVKINNDTKVPTNGIVNLGSVITEHQDISTKQDILVSGTNIKTINGNSILGGGNLEIKTTVEGDFATVEDYGSEVVMPVSNIVSMSQEEYDALVEKNPNTIYLII